MTEDRGQKAEGRGKTRDARRGGMTLIEIIVSLAIMAIIFTVIVPQFVTMRNSWDFKQGVAETLQNGRILIDHLNRNLSKAVRITAVSDSSTSSGYIQFLASDGSNLRYEIVNSYVQFGVVGNLSDLAGPVSQLQFSCYDACDLDVPLNSPIDVNSIRLVKAETTLTNPAGSDKTLTTSAYLRTNWDSETCSSEGLVGWWKLDETSGTTAEDSSSYGNDGTLIRMGGTQWTTGQISGALEFDGRNDYVNCGSDESLDITDDITIALWLRADSFRNEPDIVTKGSYNVSYSVWLDSSGRVRFALNNNRLTSGARLSTHTWYHIAVTREGNERKIYINGQEDTSDTYSTAIGTTAWPLTISTASYPFNGTLDDVRIYNVALSAEEVAQLADILKYKEFTEAKASYDTTSITISTPDTNEGDLLIAAVATDGGTSASMAPPADEDWAEIDVDDYSSEVTLGAWWKLADASESPSHQFTWSGGQQAYGWMMRFTGHDPTDPINDFSAGGESSNTPTSPAVTTTVDNCLILRLGAFDDDDITEDYPGLFGHTPITMDKSASSAGAVEYQGFTEAKRSSNGTSLTISTPGGTSEDDLLIAAVVTDGRTDTSLSPPSGEGWVEINIGRQSSAVTMGVWWKMADASESPSHRFTWSGGQEAYGWIMRFTGHNPSAPINAWRARGGSSSSPSCHSVTTTVANTMIVRIGGFDDDDIRVDNPGLSGHTAITMDKSSSGGGTCSGGAGYIQQAAIGSSGTSRFSLRRSEEYRTVTIAIAPAAGSGTVSGGAGYIGQSASGDSGTSTFSLGSSNEAQTITIAIAPDSDSGCQGQIRP